MSKLSCRNVLMLAACLGVLIALGAIASAQEKMAVAGAMTCTITDQKQFMVGDAEGHVLSLNQSTGTNASTGPMSYMDKASIANFSMGDQVKGNGPGFGYVMFALGADTTYAKWGHAVATMMGPDQKPVTTFKGTFSFERGTGQYMGIQGSGTFSGKFTSPTEYSVEWAGEYAIAK